MLVYKILSAGIFYYKPNSSPVCVYLAISREKPAMSARAVAYSIYVLVLLLVSYLLNQLDRYMISVCTKPMAQDIHYGDMACMVNKSATENVSIAATANQCNATTETVYVSYIRRGY